MNSIRLMSQISKCLRVPMREALKEINNLERSLGFSEVFTLKDSFNELWKSSLVNLHITRNRSMKLLLLYNYVYEGFSGFEPDYGDPTPQPTMLAKLGNTVRNHSLASRLDGVRAHIQKLPASDLEREKQCLRALDKLSPLNQGQIEDWVFFKNLLGNFYLHKAMENSSRYMEMAFHELQEAKQIALKEELYYDLMLILSNLSRTHLIKGTEFDPPHLEISCDLAQRAVDYWRHAAPPGSSRLENMAERIDLDQRYDSINRLLYSNLGEAYRQRVEGNGIDNQEKAFSAYKSALKDYFSAKESPFGFSSFTAKLDWAVVLSNMVLQLTSILSGDASDNIEQAIEYGEDAVAIWKEALTHDSNYRFDISEISLELYGYLLNNLAGAYAMRLGGNRRENLHKARQYFSDALDIRKEVGIDHLYAETLSNMAIFSVTEGLSGDRRDHLENAIRQLEEACEIYRNLGFSLRLGKTLINLGSILQTIYEESGHETASSDYWQKGKISLQQAESLITTDNDPFAYALLMRAFGHAFMVSPRTENHGGQAVQYFEKSLTYFTKEISPSDFIHTWNQIGTVYFAAERWEDATKAYQTAIDANLSSLSILVTESGQGSLLGELSNSYRQISYSLCMLGQYDKALYLYDQGKARLLGYSNFLQRVQSSLPSDKSKALAALQLKLKLLNEEFQLPVGSPQKRPAYVVSNEIHKTHEELENLLSASDMTYASRWERTNNPLDSVVNMPENTVVLCPLTSSHGTIILILSGQSNKIYSDNIISLPYTEKMLEDQLLIGNLKQPGFLALNLNLSGNLKQGFLSICQQLYRMIGEPIDEWIRNHGGAERIIVLLHGGMHLFPLHASCRSDGQSNYFLLEDYIFTYVPSLGLLRSNEAQEILGTPLIGGTSNSQAYSTLPHVEEEVKAIADLLKVDYLLNDRLDEETLFQRADQAGIIHLSCHGGYGWSVSPYSSSLILGGDRPLTLSRIMTRLNLTNNQLVVLSACQSGISDMAQLKDEFVGLPFGFLSAGAKQVVASLWSVHDRSTALLMTRFYIFLASQLKKGSIDPAKALRDAQVWMLRSLEFSDLKAGEQEVVRSSAILGKLIDQDVKPYSNPYFWAAFVITSTVF